MNQQYILSHFLLYLFAASQPTLKAQTIWETIEETPAANFHYLHPITCSNLSITINHHGAQIHGYRQGLSNSISA
jgi:hypothetical protein